MWIFMGNVEVLVKCEKSLWSAFVLEGGFWKGSSIGTRIVSRGNEKNSTPSLPKAPQKITITSIRKSPRTCAMAGKGDLIMLALDASWVAQVQQRDLVQIGKRTRERSAPILQQRAAGDQMENATKQNISNKVIYKYLLNGDRIMLQTNL